MPEAKDDLKREKVRIVPISNIEDFPDHPFQVKDDESMDALVESIRMNGVLNPVIALKIDENHYQSKDHSRQRKGRRLYRHGREDHHRCRCWRCYPRRSLRSL